MSVSTRWYLPDHVLLHTVHGKFKVRDMRSVRAISQKAFDHHEHLVHVVFDLREMKLAMPDRKEATDDDLAQTRAVLAHPNLGWIICVSDNWLVRLAQSMASQRNMRFRAIPDMNALDVALLDVAADLAPHLAQGV